MKKTIRLGVVLLLVFVAGDAKRRSGAREELKAALVLVAIPCSILLRLSMINLSTC